MSLSDIKLADIDSCNMLNKDLLNTGDLILCHCQKDGKLDPGLDGVIEEFTHSPFEHAAIILRDPPWLDRKGIYVYQSGSGPNNYPDVMNGNLCGVTLNYFDDFIMNRSYVCIRSMKGVTWNNKTWARFKKAFDKSHGKPYDSKPCDWCCTGIWSFLCCPCINNFFCRRQTKRFWCSALVWYIYVKMGFIGSNTDWSDKTPAQLSILELIPPSELGRIWRYN